MTNSNRRLIIKVAVFTLLLGVATYLSGEECQYLANSTPDEVVAYLNSSLDKAVNGTVGERTCIKDAIDRLGEEHYKPASELFLSLLGFRRPATDDEKNGFFIRPQTPDELYPAVAALERLGPEALPVVLKGMADPAMSDLVRNNAVSVVMYFYRDDPMKGVQLVVREGSGMTIRRRRTYSGAQHLTQSSGAHQTSKAVAKKC